MLIFLVGGFFSPIFYAQICDKFEPRNLRTNAYIAALQEFMASICYFCIFYFKINFWFACAFVALEQFLCEGVVAPSLSMMTQTAPVGQDANVMGLYMIVSNLAVLLISAILGVFISESDPLRAT